MADDQTPEARPGEVSFRLWWRLGIDGALTGELDAENICDHRVRLTGKPELAPLDERGRPLDAQTIVTLEFRAPGYAELGPGERAVSRVAWGGWNGPPAGGRVVIRWRGGEAETLASGPRQPDAPGPATNLTSSWFTRLD